MAKRVCQRCNGARTIVVRDPKTGKREVVVCPKCGGTGEEEIKVRGDSKNYGPADPRPVEVRETQVTFWRLI